MLSNLPPVTKPASGPAASESRLNQLESCAPQPRQRRAQGLPVLPFLPRLSPATGSRPLGRTRASFSCLPDPSISPVWHRVGSRMGADWRAASRPGRELRQRAQRRAGPCQLGYVPAPGVSASRCGCHRRHSIYSKGCSCCPPWHRDQRPQGWRSRGARDSWPERRGAFEETPL